MKFISPRLVLLALPLLAVPAHAAFDPAIVSADARWVVYADLNTLRGSVLGRELISGLEKNEMTSAKDRLGLDFQKLFATVGSATAYGSHLSFQANEVDGVLLFQGSPDLRKIAEALVLEVNVAHPERAVEITDLPFPAYALNHPRPSDGSKTEIIIAFPPEPVVLMSRSREQILKAREVFRGAAPSLAHQADSPLAKFLPGSANGFLFSASVVPANELFKEDGPNARIFKMTSAAALTLGENGPNTTAHIELIASSSQMADKLMKILQGMTAMLSLAEANDKQLTDFLNSTAINRNDDTVSLDLAYASDRLAQMIHNLQERAPGRMQGPLADQARLTNLNQLVPGKVLAEWQAVPTPPGTTPAPLSWHTIQNVALRNGSIISFGHRGNGGANIHFNRVEIAPSDGTGAPLVFRTNYMRPGGHDLREIEFPGTDGTYTLKVAYQNDPAGKATYAVGLLEPRPEAPAPVVPPAPAAPAAPVATPK